MNNLKKILVKIENVEKLHQKIRSFFYISKKNEIPLTINFIGNILYEFLLAAFKIQALTYSISTS